MKKILVKILLALGIVFIVIILLFVGYTIKAKSELKIITPIETKLIVDNIFSIHDSFTNLYLVKDSNRYIAIDGGNNLITISEELNKLNTNPDKVDAILLTHTDADHVASLKLLKNAKIYLSGQEEQLISGKKSKFLFFSKKIVSKEYSLIKDLQIFNIGNIKIKGILTPGHTSGSMCYLINYKYLFTGEALSLKDGKIDTFNEFFNMDTEMPIKSIKKITEIPKSEYLFTAHYG